MFTRENKNKTKVTFFWRYLILKLSRGLVWKSTRSTKCAPCHPEARRNEQPTSEICSDKPSLCQACVPPGPDSNPSLQALWEQRQSRADPGTPVLLQSNSESCCGTPHVAGVTVLPDGHRTADERCPRQGLPASFHPGWDCRQRSRTWELAPRSRCRQDPLPVTDGGPVDGGVLCTPALASVRAPAELCWEKAVTASLFRGTKWLSSRQQTPQRKRHFPSSNGDLQKMNVGCIFRGKEDVENRRACGLN